MNFRYYCLIILGDVTGVKEDIQKISEMRISFMEGKGLLMSTFYSSFSVDEINSLLLSNKKNFVVFEMLEGLYGVNLNDKVKHDQLFGGVKEFNDAIQKEMNEKLVSAIMAGVSKDIMTGNKQQVNDNDIISTVKKMSDSDKANKLDYLLDKGLENLTEYDKKYFDILSKS